MDPDSTLGVVGSFFNWIWESKWYVGIPVLLILGWLTSIGQKEQRASAISEGIQRSGLTGLDFPKSEKRSAGMLADMRVINDSTKRIKNGTHTDQDRDLIIRAAVKHMGVSEEEAAKAVDQQINAVNHKMVYRTKD